MPNTTSMSTTAAVLVAVLVPVVTVLVLVVGVTLLVVCIVTCCRKESLFASLRDEEMPDSEVRVMVMSKFEEKFEELPETRSRRASFGPGNLTMAKMMMQRRQRRSASVSRRPECPPTMVVRQQAESEPLHQTSEEVME